MIIPQSDETAANRYPDSDLEFGMEFDEEGNYKNEEKTKDRSGQMLKCKHSE